MAFTTGSFQLSLLGMGGYFRPLEILPPGQCLSDATDPLPSWVPSAVARYNPVPAISNS